MISEYPTCSYFECTNPPENPETGLCATHGRLARKPTSKTFKGTVSFKKRPLNEFDKELVKAYKKKIPKVGTKNTFECSDGTRVTQAYIKGMLNLCYGFIDEGRSDICEGCRGQPECHAHIIAQARCKVIRKTELIYHPLNIFKSCFSCNAAIENPKGQAWKKLKNLDKCMAFIKLHDAELFQKFQNNSIIDLSQFTEPHKI